MIYFQKFGIILVSKFLMASTYFLVLPFFLFSAEAKTDLSIKAFVSPASHSTQIDVIICPVIQDKLFLRAIHSRLTMSEQNSEDRVLEIHFDACIQCPLEWRLISNSHSNLIKVLPF